MHQFIKLIPWYLYLLFGYDNGTRRVFIYRLHHTTRCLKTVPQAEHLYSSPAYILEQVAHSALRAWTASIKVQMPRRPLCGLTPWRLVCKHLETKHISTKDANANLRGGSPLSESQRLCMCVWRGGYECLWMFSFSFPFFMFPSGRRDRCQSKSPVDQRTPPRRRRVRIFGPFAPETCQEFKKCATGISEPPRMTAYRPPAQLVYVVVLGLETELKPNFTA